MTEPEGVFPPALFVWQDGFSYSTTAIAPAASFWVPQSAYPKRHYVDTCSRYHVVTAPSIPSLMGTLFGLLWYKESGGKRVKSQYPH